MYSLVVSVTISYLFLFIDGRVNLSPSGWGFFVVLAFHIFFPMFGDFIANTPWFKQTISKYLMAPPVAPADDITKSEAGHVEATNVDGNTWTDSPIGATPYVAFAKSSLAVPIVLISFLVVVTLASIVGLSLMASYDDANEAVILTLIGLYFFGQLVTNAFHDELLLRYSLPAKYQKSVNDGSAPISLANPEVEASGDETTADTDNDNMYYSKYIDVVRDVVRCRVSMSQVGSTVLQGAKNICSDIFRQSSKSKKVSMDQSMKRPVAFQDNPQLCDVHLSERSL